MLSANLWPVDAVSGAPSYTGRALRQAALSVLLGGGSGTRPLAGRSGVNPRTPSTTVTASSATWTVNPHAGVIDAETASQAGSYAYSFDAAQTGSMNAADATNPRIDLISVQVSDPAEGDGTSTPGVAVVYTVGTPAPTPSVPATPARSLALAQITVPKSGGGSPSVTWVAPSMAAAGGIIPTSGSSAYPATPYVGQYIDDPTLGLLRWSGSVWQTFGLGDTGWINIGLASGYTASGGWTPQYRAMNGVVYFRGFVQPSSGTFAQGTVTISTALPSNRRPATGYVIRTAATDSGVIQGRLFMPASGGILEVGFNASGANYVDLSALSYPLG